MVRGSLGEILNHVTSPTSTGPEDHGDHFTGVEGTRILQGLSLATFAQFGFVSVDLLSKFGCVRAGKSCPGATPRYVWGRNARASHIATFSHHLTPVNASTRQAIRCSWAKKMAWTV